MADKKNIPITRMIVYKTTNLINGKIYIGQSVKNDPKYLGSGDLIVAAIKKYGKNNFIKEILEECENINELNEKERKYIASYNSTDKNIGYNIAIGGTNGTMLNRKHSEITKKKMSECSMVFIFSDENKENISKANLGRVISDETKEKMSASQKLMKHLPMSNEIKEKISESKKGKKASEETKQKMSIAHIGGKNHFYGKKYSNKTLSIRRKPIYQLTINGEFIQEWVGVNVAAKSLNISPSSISYVLTGKIQSTKNFKFIYKNG